MTNRTWRILLHTTDGDFVTWTLSSFTWKGDKKIGHGTSAMGTCRWNELHRTVDQLADLVGGELELAAGGQDSLPPF